MQVNKNRHKSKTFCIMPWINFNVNVNGTVSVCCMSKDSHLGDVSKQTITDIWNSEKFIKVRKKMYSGEALHECTSCYDTEKAGVLSLRQVTNEKYKEYFLNVEQSKETNYVLDYNPILLDLRFSNICNLKCRSCWHGNSSKWYEDAMILGEAIVDRPIMKCYSDSSFMEQIKELLPNVEEVYFAGGEPLLMKEHYQILDFFVSEKMYEVRLSYNTNMTFKTYQNIDIFNIWNKFKNVYIGASLDGTKERCEYLRSGLVWKDVLMNRQKLITECPNVYFYITPTISVFNIYTIFDFHREWLERGYINSYDFYFNLLNTPDYYDIRILPFYKKEEVKKVALNYLNWINEYLVDKIEKGHEIFKKADVKEMSTKAIYGLLNYLYSDDKTDKIPEFRRRCIELDEIRGEKTIDIFPEIKELFVD